MPATSFLSRSPINFSALRLPPILLLVVCDRECVTCSRLIDCEQRCERIRWLCWHFSLCLVAVLIYNQLMHMQNYTFDESIIPSMPIPDMTAPPPLPPKRRLSKKPVRNQRETHIQKEKQREGETESRERKCMQERERRERENFGVE